MQNNVEQTVKSNILSPSLNLRWKKLSWLQLSNETTFNLSWQDKYQNSAGYSLRSWFEALRLYVYPLKKISMEIDCEYTSTETERGQYNRNTFVDFRMTYNPVNHIELGLTLSNVFDRHEYVEASFTGLNYQYYSMPLRGREVLFSVKYELHWLQGDAWFLLKNVCSTAYLVPTLTLRQHPINTLYLKHHLVS